MKFLRLWLAAILFIFNLSASAQHRYVEKMLKVDGNNKIDLAAVDKIGQIILSGYLDGKIKAYRFAIKDSVLKWSVPMSIPPNWHNKEFYNPGDRVLHNNIAYESQIEAIGQEPKDFGNDYWVRVELREPLLKRRFYPTEKDTLTKAEFLSRMVSQQPEIFPAWDAAYDYYPLDIVTYKGKNYEALQESRAKVPGENNDFWAITNRGSIQFHRLGDAKTVSVLFNYSVVQSDTTWNPQMVAVKVWDDNYGAYKQLAYFKYDDVMNYLEKVPQPVINNVATNRLSNTLLVQNQRQRPELLNWLKAKFKAKQITAAPKWISNPAIFQAWLSSSDTIDNSYYAKWRFYQDLNSRDLVLVRMEYKDDRLKSQPFLTIPVKALEKMFRDLQIKTPALQNYTDALQDITLFSTHEESHNLDSLQPLRPRFKSKILLAREYFFVEKYSADLSEGRNPVITKMLPQAWPIIEKQFYAKALKEETFRASFYEDNFDWRSINPWKQFGITHSFDQEFGLDDYWYYYRRDSIPSPQQFTQIFVTYRKYFSTGKFPAVQFEPIYISIELIDNNANQSGIPNGVYFKWPALKEQLLKSGSTFASFISAIETGRLEFYDSELLYGLREK